MQPFETPHDYEVGFGTGRAATADAQNFGLLGDQQIVRAVDHRFALSNPALLSAPSKKSFSSGSSPIFACSDFTSTGDCAAALPPLAERVARSTAHCLS
jgi:hypothetical protein